MVDAWTLPGRDLATPLADVEASWANLGRHLQQLTPRGDRRIDPAMGEVFPWTGIPDAHEKMLDNQHTPGNMAVLVSTPRSGLRTFEDVLEASGAA